MPKLDSMVWDLLDARGLSSSSSRLNEMLVAARLFIIGMSMGVVAFSDSVPERSSGGGASRSELEPSQPLKISVVSNLLLLTCLRSRLMNSWESFESGHSCLSFSLVILALCTLLGRNDIQIGNGFVGLGVKGGSPTGSKTDT